MKVATFKMTGGLTGDTRPELVPPDTWTECINFTFGRADNSATLGVATRVVGCTAAWATPNHGIAPQFGLNVDIYGAASRTATNYRWYGGVNYGGTTAKIGQQTGGVDSDVTPASIAGTAGRWTGGVLNNFVPFLNNQADRPHYWDYTAPAWTPLANLPTGSATATFTALRSYREFLIGMGLFIPAGSYRSDVVYWSDASAYNTPPTTWISAATNQAGDAVLPGGGEIVDGAVLGQDFIIYKASSSYRMTYTGGNFVMSIRPLFKGWGCWSQNCAVEYGGKHYVFTGKDLIVHDGQRWESCLTGKVRENIVLGSTEPKNSFVFADQTSREIWVCTTRQGLTYPSVAAVYNTDTGQCGWRQLSPGISHIVQDQQEDQTRIGVYPGTGSASSGRFFDMNSGTQFNGTNITATISREMLDFGNPSVHKVVKWVRPWVQSATAGAVMTVEVAGTNNVDDTLTYGAAVNFTIASSDKADVFAEGRWLSFRFGSTDDSARWTIAGFEVGYEERGVY